eukprot:421490-Hanusia_phi.AAC.3
MASQPQVNVGSGDKHSPCAVEGRINAGLPLRIAARTVIPLLAAWCQLLDGTQYICWYSARVVADAEMRKAAMAVS